jgi:hypothetical protein
MRALRITSSNTATRWRRIAGIKASPKHTGKKDQLAPHSRFSRPRFGRFTARHILYSNRLQILKTASAWMKARDAQAPKQERPRKWASWMDQYRNDPQHKIKHLLRKRIRNTVQRGDKAAPTMELLGCTREHFMAHIERQFKRGMTWDNHGVGEGKWNLDHIQACASFDLTRADHQRICFHWTNIRPMWAIDNIKKGDSMTHPHMHLRLDA